MQPPAATDDPAPKGGVGSLVVKNTLYLTLAQVLTIPLGILTNAAMGRYLGAEEFGHIYLAGTLAGFGFLAVDWGHNGALPALVAKDRTLAGKLLGSSLAWRAVTGFLVYGVLALACHLLGYGAHFQWALGLSCVWSLLTSFTAALKDSIRGFERTDIPAYSHIAHQLLSAIFMLGTLALGGHTRAVLTASSVGIGIVLVAMLPLLKSVGFGRLSVDAGTLKSLFKQGTPFVFFGVATALVPNIDAVFLSKLAPAEVMGWYAASRKLIGVLLLPASAMIGALYPTLCRLYLTDTKGFNDASRGALRWVTLMVVPVALGCALYPEIGVAVFSTKKFGPAEDNLRVLAPFLVLVYFSMPLGTCLMAAGRQVIWSAVMVLCVLVSVVLDPLLIPIFQARANNGGLGLCIASVTSELIVVVIGLFMIPKGVLDRSFVRSVLLALVSGAAMAAVVFGTRWLTPFIAAPIAVAVYAVVLVATGGVEKEQIAAISGMVQRRIARFRGNTP